MQNDSSPNLKLTRLRKNRHARPFLKPNHRQGKKNKSTPLSQSLVVNLSSHSLSQTEISLLELGMNFCPTPTANPAILKADFLNFRKRLRNQFKFGPLSDSPPKFCNKSKYFPRESSSLLENFVDDLQIKTQNLLLCSKPLDSQSKPKISPFNKTLSNLKRDQSIIFKPADKSGVVVILDKTDYMSESYRQLNNRKYYVPLIWNPIEMVADLVLTLLFKLLNLHAITKRNFEYLKPSIPIRTPVFYYLPKIHKETINGIHPGRPIISAYNSPVVGISELTDSILNPLVQSLPSYIRDTSHLLNIIQNLPPLPKDVFLISLDVSSLYTNVPHHHALLAAEWFLDQRKAPHRPPTALVLEMLNLIQNNNFFQFNDLTFHQIMGVTMGNIASPAIACLFMGMFEKLFLEQLPSQPLVFKRFIDDLFIILNAPILEVQAFLRNINRFHPSIKFTWNVSLKKMIFLDLLVYKGNDFPVTGKLSTNLHTKPTNVHQYLRFNSCHPDHCLVSIIFSQGLRFHRIISDQPNLIYHLRCFAANLQQRGYPSHLILKYLNKAIQIPRETALLPSTKPKFLTRPPLVLTYNPAFKTLPKVLHHLFEQIDIDPNCKVQFPEHPILAFRRPKNLGDFLISSKFQEHPPIRSKHASKTCLTCPARFKGTTLQSSVGPFSFPVDITLNCKSRCIIYAIICRYCKQMYIGETGLPLHTRFNLHRSACKKSTPATPLAVHFSKPNHEFTQTWVTPIMSVTHSVERKFKEKHLIKNLATFYPYGINNTPVPVPAPV
jgi:hypothetical protein